MEVRRIDPESGLLRTFWDYDDRIKKVETRTTGEIVIRESVRAIDPITGVETIIGVLPDGTIGFQPFVGDTEPPPVPTMPTASVEPGSFVVSWDGGFFGGAPQPKDFEHVNVIGRQVVGGVAQAPITVGVIRLSSEKLVVSTDVCPVGTAWRFTLASEDYNGNISTSSIPSADVTMASFVIDAGINDALADLQQDVSDADQKAQNAQLAAEDAQDDADAANAKAVAIIAGGANLILNGDFEQPNNLGWAFFSGTSIEASTGTARSGTKVLRGTLSSGNRYAYTDYISSGTNRTLYVEYWVRLREALVPGNEALTFGAWYSSTVPGSANSVVATYGPTDPQVTGYSPLNTPLSMGDLSTTVWKKFSTIYTVTAVGATTTRFGPRIPGTTLPGNTVEIDDFRVIDITESFNAQVKADQAFNSAEAAALSAGNAQLAADAKATIWYQNDPPTGIGHKVGDTWYDTNNGNRANRWSGPPTNQWVDAQDSAIFTAQDTADGAVQAANGKNKNYYQTTMPAGTSYNVGDIWWDTDDQWKQYTWSGSAWITTQDSGLAMTIANSKIKTFTQSGTPTATTVGDIWIDTGNKNNIKVWNGSAWISRVDIGIKDAADLAGEAKSDAQGALNAANGKNKNYYQTTQPTGGTYQAGDIWWDTDDAWKQYTYTGSTWQATQDSNGALLLAQGKNQTFVGGTAPTAQATGDIWIDTANQNRMKRWSGPSGSPANTWVDVRDAFIQEAWNKGDTALTAANGKNKIIFSTSDASGTVGYVAGDMWMKRNGSGNIIGQWEFTTSWQVRQLDSAVFANIDAGKIAVGTLNGDRIISNSISVKELAVTDPTNFAPSYAESPRDWEMTTGITNVVTAIAAAYDKRRFTSNGITDGAIKYARGPWVAVVPGDELYAEGTIYRAGPTSNDVYLRYYYYSENKTFVSSNAVTLTGGAVATNSPNGFFQQIKSVVPAGVMYARLLIVFTNTTGDDVGMYNVRGYRRNNANLMVDGMITANSAIIADLAIGTAKIANAAITDAKIVNLNASKIDAGFISVARLEGGSISADKLSIGAGSNLLADPQLQDPDLTAKRLAISNATQTAGIWSVASTGEITLTWTSGTHTSAQEGFNFRPVASGSGATLMPVVPGTRYRIQFEAFRAAGTTPAVRSAIYYKTTAGTFPFIADSTPGYYSLPVDGWQTVTREWLAPVDAVSCNIDLQVQLTGNANGLKFRNPSVVSMTTGTLIEPNSITTTHVQANSISVEKLLIGSMDNLISDPNFTGATGVAWDLSGTGFSIDPTGARSLGPAFKIANSAVQQGKYNNPIDIPIIPESSYRMTAYIKSDVAIPANGVKLYARLRTPTNTSTVTEIYTSTALAANVWHKISGIVKAGTTHTKVSFGFFSEANFSTGNLWIDYVAANRMGDGQLLVDGAIQAGSAIIGELAVGTAQIANLAITDAKIASLNASKIDAGFLSAARIEGGSINASKLTIGDFTNLLDDGSFESGSNTKSPWIVGSGANIQTDAGRSNTYVLRSNVAGRVSGVAAEQTSIAVKTGDTVVVGGWIYLSAATSAVNQIRITGWFKDKAGAHVGSGAFVDLPNGFASGWNYWGPTAIKITQANVESMNLQLNVATTYTGTAMFDDIAVRRQVGATLIENGAITTGHISVSGLDAAVMTTGVLNAALIGSKAIKADQLVISSTNNLVVEADFSNGGTSWSTGSAISVVAGVGRGGGPVLRVTGAASTTEQKITNLSNKFTVGSEDHFRASAYVKSTAPLAVGRIQLKARAFTTATASTEITLASNTVLVANQWKLIEGFSPDLPSNTIALEFFLSVTNNATGTITDIDYVSVTRASDGKLIVDGAIDGKTITAPTIQTTATALRGIKLITNSDTGVGEFAGWDAAGQKNFSLTTAGVLSMKGPIVSGGSITGALLQTDEAVNTGVKFTTSGIKAYNPSNAITFDLDSTTGNLTATGVFKTSVSGTRVVLQDAIASGGAPAAEIRLYSGTGNAGGTLTSWDVGGGGGTTSQTTLAHNPSSGSAAYGFISLDTNGSINIVSGWNNPTPTTHFNLDGTPGSRNSMRTNGEFLIEVADAGTSAQTYIQMKKTAGTMLVRGNTDATLSSGGTTTVSSIGALTINAGTSLAFHGQQRSGHSATDWMIHGGTSITQLASGTFNVVFTAPVPSGLRRMHITPYATGPCSVGVSNVTSSGFTLGFWGNANQNMSFNYTGIWSP